MGALDASALEYVLSGLNVTAHAEHDDWFGILCASHFVTAGDPEAMEVFVRWSAGNPDFAHLSREVRRRWQTLSRKPGNGVATLIWRLHREERDDIASRLSEELAVQQDKADAEWLEATVDVLS